MAAMKAFAKAAEVHILVRWLYFASCLQIDILIKYAGTVLSKCLINVPPVHPWEYMELVVLTRKVSMYYDFIPFICPKVNIACS